MWRAIRRDSLAKLSEWGGGKVELHEEIALLLISHCTTHQVCVHDQYNTLSAGVCTFLQGERSSSRSRGRFFAGTLKMHLMHLIISKVQMCWRSCSRWNCRGGVGESGFTPRVLKLKISARDALCFSIHGGD